MPRRLRQWLMGEATHWRVLVELELLKGYIPGGEPLFLVRVDDFPRWDQETTLYPRFHRLLAEREIPYLLGVTPFLVEQPADRHSRNYRRLSDYERGLLSTLSQEGVEIALHGFTHQTRYPRPRSELLRMSDQRLAQQIEEGLRELGEIGLSAEAFIPPFNAFSRQAARVLARYFRVLCGGPESVKFVGFRLAPSCLEGMFYLPSYPPAYGPSSVLCEFVTSLLEQPLSWPVPLTIHWAWEVGNEFEGIRRLAALVEGKVRRWSEWIQELSQRWKMIFDLAGN